MLKILLAIILVVGIGCGDIWDLHGGITKTIRNGTVVESAPEVEITQDEEGISADENPNMLKILLIGDGPTKAIFATRTIDTGRWTVVYYEERMIGGLGSTTSYISDEKGNVVIG
jgi:hypothetical protein